MTYGIFSSLAGTEILQVRGIAANSMPSGQTGQCTTQQIANLANAPVTLVSTATASATTNTTLATVAGLSKTLAAGTYSIYAYLAVSSNATGGIKVALGGTLGASSCNYTAKNYNGTTLNANTNTTTFGNAVGGANAVATLVELEGSVSVATAGTLGVQFAQNTSNSGASSVLLGSYINIAKTSS